MKNLFILLSSIPLIFFPNSIQGFSRPFSVARSKVINNEIKLVHNDSINCGAIPPLGKWDPLNITSNCDDRMIVYLREAEQQHGRVAMASTVILPIIDIYDKSDIAINAYQNHPSEIAFSVFMMYEIVRILVLYENPQNKAFRLKKDVYPGNTFKYNVSDISIDLVNKELSNGRLAMIGSIIYIMQELITQNKILG